MNTETPGVELSPAEALAAGVAEYNKQFDAGPDKVFNAMHAITDLRAKYGLDQHRDIRSALSRVVYGFDEERYEIPDAGNTYATEVAAFRDRRDLVAQIGFATRGGTDLSGLDQFDLPKDLTEAIRNNPDALKTIATYEAKQINNQRAGAGVHSISPEEHQAYAEATRLLYGNPPQLPTRDSLEELHSDMAKPKGEAYAAARELMDAVDQMNAENDEDWLASPAASMKASEIAKKYHGTQIDEILRAIKEIKPEYEQKERGLFTRMCAEWDRAKIERVHDKLVATGLDDKNPIERVRRKQLLRAMLPENINEDDGWFSKGLVEVSAQGPMMAEMALSAGAVKAIGATLGLSTKAATALATVVSGSTNLPSFVESSYMGYLEQDVPTDTARTASIVSGVVQSAIETINLVPFLPKGASSGVTKRINNVVLKYITAQGVNFLKEVSEEGLQQLADDLTIQVMGQFDADVPDEIADRSVLETAERSIKASLEALRPTMFMVAPGAIGGAMTGGAQRLADADQAAIERDTKYAALRDRLLRPEGTAEFASKNPEVVARLIGQKPSRGTLEHAYDEVAELSQEEKKTAGQNLVRLFPTAENRKVFLAALEKVGDDAPNNDAVRTGLSLLPPGELDNAIADLTATRDNLASENTQKEMADKNINADLNLLDQEIAELTALRDIQSPPEVEETPETSETETEDQADKPSLPPLEPVPQRPSSAETVQDELRTQTKRDDLEVLETRPSNKAAVRVRRGLNALGKKARFFRTNDGKESQIRGYHDPADAGTVWINADLGEDGLHTAATHEWVHSLREQDPDVYEYLAKTLAEFAPTQIDNVRNQYRAALEAVTGENGTNALLDEEAVAGLAEDLATKADFWNALSKDKTMLQKVVDVVKNIINRLRDKTVLSPELQLVDNIISQAIEAEPETTLESDSTPPVENETDQDTSGGKLALRRSVPPVNWSGKPRKKRLANPGESTEVEKLYSDVEDELGAPVSRPMDEVQKEASARLQFDRDGERQALIDMAKGGGAFGDTGVVIAKQLINEEGSAAIKSGDPKKIADAMLLVRGYMSAGTYAARELAARRSPKNETVEQRRERHLTEALLTPPKRMLNSRSGTGKGKGNGDGTGTVSREEIERINTEWAEKCKQLEMDLRAAGIEIQNLREIAKDPKASAKVLREISARKADAWDALYEYWRNSILSAATTHAANTIGNAGHAAWIWGIERPTEALLNSIASVMGMDPKGATFGEFKVLANAFAASIGEAKANFVKAWDLEIPSFERELGRDTHTKVEEANVAISGKLGRVIRTPQRFLLAADEFTKTLVARAEVAAMAYRIATNEGLEGKAKEQRITELTTDTNSAAWDAAIDQALEVTFQTQAGKDSATSWILRGRSVIPGLRYLVPFVTTPMNIAKTGMKKSPLGTFKVLADVVRGKRENLSKDIAQQVIAWATVGALAYLNNPEDDDAWLRITGTRGVSRAARQEQKRAIPPRSISYSVNGGSMAGMNLLQQHLPLPSTRLRPQRLAVWNPPPRSRWVW